ncbi:alpha-1,2-fucosyltransferase [Coraliomargarita sp. W4R53]
MKKRIFIRKKYGRLGNNLYRWAHLIAFARDHDAEVWDLSRTTNQYFRFFPKLNRKLLPVVAERHFFSIGCSFIQYQIGKVLLRLVRMCKVRWISNVTGKLELSNEVLFEDSDSILVCGFRFLAIDSLAKHSDYIRYLFSPPKAVIAAAEAFIRQRMVGDDLIVAVHIRRGDYAEFMGGAYCFGIDVYTRILRCFAAEHSGQKCKFLIFSDDDNLDLNEFSGLDVEASGFKYGRYYDWFLMSKCHYIIAPPSTYSGWASFYGNVPIGRVERDSNASLEFSVNTDLDDELSCEA